MWKISVLEKVATGPWEASGGLQKSVSVLFFFFPFPGKMVRSFNQHLKEVGHQKRLGVTLLERLRRTSFHIHVIYRSGPQPFWHQGAVL